MFDISVIIVNYKGWKHLENCLNAFDTFTSEFFSFEVIIVDNCSNDGFFSVFQRQFPKYNFVENSGNNGFSNGCNLGAKKARGEYLLFLNSDIIATERAIDVLLQSIRDRSELFILSCRHMSKNGSVEQMSRLFPSFLTLNGIFRSVHRCFLKSNLNSSLDIIYPDWVSGSVILISRENFDVLGGWDERYWLYYEDVDLCRRTVNNGGIVGLHTGISVIHNHGGSTRINLKTAALTKSEVYISLHVYLSIHFSGLKLWLLQVIVLFETLLIRLVPALLGILCFYIKRLALYRIIYFKMIDYYFSAIRYKTWVSPRSMRFKRN